MMMKIMFYNEQDKCEFTDDMKQAICSAISHAGESEQIDGVINVLITDDTGIKELNSQFRNNNAPTDVLSFPNYFFEGLLKDSLTDLEREYQDGDFFLGDIAVSLERAYEQAKTYNHSPVREAAFLTLHGALHIMGYDHIEKEDELIMNEKQKRLLNEIGLLRN